MRCRARRRRSRSWPARRGADVPALEDVLRQSSALADDLPAVVELDCNPVMVSEGGASFVADAVVAVDPAVREVRCASGRVLAYDALLIAAGATVQPAFEQAETIGDEPGDGLITGDDDLFMRHDIAIG